MANTLLESEAEFTGLSKRFSSLYRTGRCAGKKGNNTANPVP
jgi:hypothetical protein